LGLLGLYLFERYRHRAGGLFILLCAAAAQLLMADYGFYGVVLIAGFYLWGRDLQGIFLVLAAVNALFYFGTMQMFSVLAFVPLALYNGKEGIRCKGLFYLFYPLHLAALWGFSLLI